MYFRATVIALLAVSLLLHLQTQVQLSHALHDRAHSHADRAHSHADRVRSQADRVRKHAPPPLDPNRPTQLVDLRGDRDTSSQLMASARWVPSLRDGKPLGVKVYAVAPDSSPAAWGLQNGDTVLSINGLRPLSARFMDLLASDCPPAFWDLEIERKGQRQRIVVLVHG